MKILGIDTSTVSGSIGLINDDELIAEYTFNIQSDHSANLFPVLDELLTRAEIPIESIDGFAVTIGPGSFTGVRIGVSAVKSMSFALNKPAMGIPTLDAIVANLAYPLFKEKVAICPILDAKRNEVYTAIYEVNDGILNLITDYLAISVSELLEKCASFDFVIFTGSGLSVYGDAIKSNIGERCSFANPTFWLPRGGVVAQMGLYKLKKGIFNDGFSLLPIYVRPVYAKAQ